nr:MAG TPA: hypothetical protein [Caudoviricetes sp.]
MFYDDARKSDDNIRKRHDKNMVCKRTDFYRILQAEI